jgi:hypothetical protein
LKDLKMNDKRTMNDSSRKKQLKPANDYLRMRSYTEGADGCECGAAVGGTETEASVTPDPVVAAVP